MLMSKPLPLQWQEKSDCNFSQIRRNGIVLESKHGSRVKIVHNIHWSECNKRSEILHTFGTVCIMSAIQPRKDLKVYDGKKKEYARKGKGDNECINEGESEY